MNAQWRTGFALLSLLGCGDGDGEFTPSDGGQRDSATADSAAQDAADQDAATDGSSEELSFGSASAPGCDLNGYWLGRQTVINEALSVPQVASTWYLMAIRQDGDVLRVIDHLDCGAAVDGTVDVSLPRDTMVSLAHRNDQTGRSGTFARNGDACELEFERFWSVRGVDPEAYLPEGRNAEQSVTELKAEAPLPDDRDPSGAEDWNGDAYAMPGVAWVVQGIVSGTRWSVQRDWQRWFSNDDHAIELGDSDTEIVATVRFDNEESVLSTDPADNSLLRSGSTARTNDPHNQVTLQLLGRDASDAQVAALLAKGVAERCLQVQSLLPPFIPDGL